MWMTRACFAFALLCGGASFADAYLRRLRCPDKCNPHPGIPVNRCFYLCRSIIPYGIYYDGTECYHLSPLGNFFDWRGYCYRGFCLTWKPRAGGSAAQEHCSNTTTTKSPKIVTTGRASQSVPVATEKASDNTPSSTPPATVSDSGTSDRTQKSSAAPDVTSTTTVSQTGSKDEAEISSTSQTTTVSENSPTVASINDTENDDNSTTPITRRQRLRRQRVFQEVPTTPPA
uniref:Putative secreted mucin n=1 Tax=Amblyomma tuberculatum TaxID=48802 RepID=A0A6M2E5M8_9ACAR